MYIYFQNFISFLESYIRGLKLSPMKHSVTLGDNTSETILLKLLGFEFSIKEEEGFESFGSAE